MQVYSISPPQDSSSMVGYGGTAYPEYQLIIRSEISSINTMVELF